MLGRVEGKRRMGGGVQRMIWLDSITSSVDMNISKLQETVRNRQPGMLQLMMSQKIRHDLATEQQQLLSP